MDSGHIYDLRKRGLPPVIVLYILLADIVCNVFLLQIIYIYKNNRRSVDLIVYFYEEEEFILYTINNIICRCGRLNGYVLLHNNEERAIVKGAYFSLQSK